MPKKKRITQKQRAAIKKVHRKAKSIKAKHPRMKYSTALKKAAKKKR